MPLSAGSKRSRPRKKPPEEKRMDRTAEITRQTLPVSVVVRTKNRPALLRDAMASIHATGYPAEIVVVNDGGPTPDVDGASVMARYTFSPRANET